MKRLLPTIGLFLGLLFVPQAQACDNTAFELLSTLTGEWQVTRKGESLGKMSISEAAGGCALVEQWSAADGTRATALHWSETPAPEDDEEVEPKPILKQVYVDSTGWVMQADGEVKDDVLVWSGETVLEGEDVRLRNTVHGLGTDTIVHIGDISKDDGETWQRISSLRYKRLP